MKADDHESLDIPANERFEVLKTAYLQVCSQNQFLRDRIIKISAAALGIMIVADVLFITIVTQHDVATRTRVATSIGVVSILLIAAHWCLAHFREYLGTAKMIKRFEDAMGFHTPSVYLPSESLLTYENKHWKYSPHIINACFASPIFFAACSVALMLLL